MRTPDIASKQRKISLIIQDMTQCACFRCSYEDSVTYNSTESTIKSLFGHLYFSCLDVSTSTCTDRYHVRY